MEICWVAKASRSVVDSCVLDRPAHQYFPVSLTGRSVLYDYRVRCLISTYPVIQNCDRIEVERARRVAPGQRPIPGTMNKRTESLALVPIFGNYEVEITAVGRW
jgi:hypothetical protein